MTSYFKGLFSGRRAASERSETTPSCTSPAASLEDGLFETAAHDDDDETPAQSRSEPGPSAVPSADGRSRSPAYDGSDTEEEDAGPAVAPPSTNPRTGSTSGRTDDKSPAHGSASPKPSADATTPIVDGSDTEDEGSGPVTVFRADHASTTEDSTVSIDFDDESDDDAEPIPQRPSSSVARQVQRRLSLRAAVTPTPASVVAPYDSEDENEDPKDPKIQLRRAQRALRRRGQTVKQDDIRKYQARHGSADQAEDAAWRTAFVDQARAVAVEAAAAGGSDAQYIDPEVVMDNSPLLRAVVQVLRHQVIEEEFVTIDLTAEHIRSVMEEVEQRSKSPAPASRKRKRDTDEAEDEVWTTRRRRVARQTREDVPAADITDGPVSGRKLQSVLVKEPVVDVVEEDGKYKARVNAKAPRFDPVVRTTSGQIFEPTVESNLEEPSEAVDMVAVRRAETSLPDELVRLIITLIED